MEPPSSNPQVLIWVFPMKTNPRCKNPLHVTTDATTDLAWKARHVSWPQYFQYNESLAPPSLETSMRDSKGSPPFCQLMWPHTRDHKLYHERCILVRDIKTLCYKMPKLSKSWTLKSWLHEIYGSGLSWTDGHDYFGVSHFTTFPAWNLLTPSLSRRNHEIYPHYRSTTLGLQRSNGLGPFGILWVKSPESYPLYPQYPKSCIGINGPDLLGIDGHYLSW
jgi:hypothetical protein